MESKQYIQKANRRGYKVARVKRVGTTSEGLPIFEVVTPNVNPNAYTSRVLNHFSRGVIDLTDVKIIKGKKHHLLPYDQHLTLKGGGLVMKDTDFNMVL